jgi:hypothetical protein
MYERGHESSYRAAFQTASAELNEVFREVERLCLRKEKVEKVLDALKPLLDSPRLSIERELAAPSLASEPVQPEEEFAPEAAQTEEVAAASARYEAPGPDPIQRRIDSILGLAVA